MPPIVKPTLTNTSFLVPTALGNTLAEFLSDRDLGGVRPATLTYYRNEVSLFLRWAAEVGARALSDLTPDLLRAYFLTLRERRNPKGVHINFGAVKTWLLWAWLEYDCPGECPIRKVRVARPSREPKPGIPLEDAGKLLAACAGEMARRDFALLYFLLDTGLRRREVCALTLAQLDGDMIHLLADGTKTGKARLAFLSRDTKRALYAYFTTRPDPSPTAPLFATRYGDPLTPNGLHEIIKRLCRRAGIPSVGVHDFRRTFALESLRGGADLLTVSRLLGHTQVETTKLYLALEEDDLRRSHEHSSPVRKLKGRKKG